MKLQPKKVKAEYFNDRLGKDSSNKIDSRTGELFREYYKTLTSISQKYDEPVLIHDEEMSKCCTIIQYSCVLEQYNYIVF